MSTRCKVLIVGAGPSGLTAAYELTRTIDPTGVIVLEADPKYVGGISRTERHGEFRFDIGGHRFFSLSAAITQLWREILPNDFISRPRLSRILYKGKYYSYPLNLAEVLRNLGLIESGLCGLSFLKAKLMPKKSVVSFHDWVANAFGERLFNTFFKTYTEKVWGMSCDEISADWAAQRIKGLSLWAAVRDALKRSLGVRPRSGDTVVKTLIEEFHYPRRGPGMMWEAAESAVQARGGRVLKGYKVFNYTLLESGTWRVTAEVDGRLEEFLADSVITSAPMADVAGQLSPQMPKDVESAAKSLRYRDYFTVALMLDRPATFPDNWIYIHDPGVRVGRIQNYSSWSPEMVPSDKHSCLGFEYFCAEGDEHWTAPDSELVALAVEEGRRLGMVDPDSVIEGVVVRQPKAYPVYDDAYKSAVASVRACVQAQYRGLQLVGRNGQHRYNNADHAMMTGLLAARNVALGRAAYNVWGVNEDAAYHEAGLNVAPSGDELAALRSDRLVPMRVANA